MQNEIYKAKYCEKDLFSLPRAGRKVPTRNNSHRPSAMDVSRAKKLWHRLYRIICCCLLSLILIYVSSVYFEYGTDTNAAIYTPIKQQLPIVSLCFDLTTFIFSNFTGKYFLPKHPSFVSLTTRTIFKQSPPASKLLKACSYIKFETKTFWRNINATECTSLFNITRYRMQGYMCYKLQFTPTEYSFYLNTNTIFSQRMLFRFELNSPFDKGHVILPVLHFNKLPYDERMFNQELISSIKLPGSYSLSYDLYELTKLSAPYSSKCEYGRASRSECYNLCRELEYFKLNYSHLHSILPEEQAVKDLQVTYFGDDEFPILSRIQKRCWAKCTVDSCRQKLAITHISNIRSSAVLTFTVETAHAPITKVVHVAKFQLADYCLQCISWAGIVVGFSLVSAITLRQFSGKNLVARTELKLMLIQLNIRKLTDSLFTRGFRRQNAETIARFNCSNRKTRRRLAPFLVGYTIVTFILLLWQLSNVITNFFLFETTWKFNYEVAYDLELPNTGICLSLEDLMHAYSPLNESNYHSITSRIDAKLNLTLAEMFSLTPGKEVLSECRVRKWDNLHLPMVLHNKSECSKVFEFEKIFAAGKMCFIFHPHQLDADRRYWRLALNPINQRAIYSLVPDFGNIKSAIMELVVYLGDGAPLTSKKHSAITPGTSSKRMQFVSYNLYQMKLLPPPYDTRCSKFTENACKLNCFSDGFKKVNRLSGNEIYTLPSNDRIIQYSDLTNQSINKFWVSLEDKCYKKCISSLCEYNYTSTKHNYKVDRSEFKLEIVVTSSQNPLTSQVAIARVKFYDFLYQILCSFSFWVGFSFLSLDQVEQKHRLVFKLRGKFLAQLQWLNYLFSLVNHQKVLLKQVENIHLKGRVKKALPKLLCSIGCIIHIAYSLDYFRYLTILDTIRKFDTETSYTLTLCIDSYFYFTSQKGIKSPTQAQFHMLRSTLVNMSIEEMFEKTPDENNIISLCRAWGGLQKHREVNNLSMPVDRLMLQINGTKCQEYFRVKKSFIQNKICYSFTPRVKLDWNRDQLDNAVRGINMNGCLYMVSINSSLVGKKFSVLVTTATSQLLYSSMWSSYFVADYDFSRWHIVSYSKYIQRVLPPPYSDGGFTHMMHMKCIDSCINRPLEALNKSLTSIFNVPSSNRLITFADRVRNKTFNAWLNQRLELCESKCKQVQLKNFEPETEFTVTDMSSGRPSRSSIIRWRDTSLASFYLRRSDSSVVVIIFKAQISFFEFLITLGSVISIWFGLSILGVPHSLIQQGQRSVTEIVHELRLKMDLLGQITENI